ncbi:DUF4177 domain-containing protein [Algicella marina]|uniref:DUF4177 domain-containing protein n=1 Tax=Algicella marina TaxID=2683284 RepID=A0A6P1SXN7_9RHOB|nr:DUF4177 domain-containing protein [Algicella marina]QHQ34103.1 DUF4177 domain-containing protein [Algicella marina]
MQNFEYRVVSAPRKARRAKGAKTPQDRFARTLTDVINAEAENGWEYLRAESLPVEEKKGMLSSPTESYHSVLVFRRNVTAAPSPFRERLEPRATPPQAPRARPQKEQGVAKPMTLGPATED